MQPFADVFRKRQALRPAIFFKRDSNTGDSRGYYEIFKSSFFIEQLRVFVL